MRIQHSILPVLAFSFASGMADASGVVPSEASSPSIRTVQQSDLNLVRFADGMPGLMDDGYLYRSLNWMSSVNCKPLSYEGVTQDKKGVYSAEFNSCTLDMLTVKMDNGATYVDMFETHNKQPKEFSKSEMMAQYLAYHLDNKRLESLYKRTLEEKFDNIVSDPDHFEKTTIEEQEFITRFLSESQLWQKRAKEGNVNKWFEAGKETSENPYLPEINSNNGVIAEIEKASSTMGRAIEIDLVALEMIAEARAHIDAGLPPKEFDPVIEEMATSLLERIKSPQLDFLSYTIVKEKSAPNQQTSSVPNRRLPQQSFE